MNITKILKTITPIINLLSSIIMFIAVAIVIFNEITGNNNINISNTVLFLMLVIFYLNINALKDRK